MSGKAVGAVPESKLTMEARKLVAGGWGKGTLKSAIAEWIILYGKTRTGKSSQALSFVEYAVMKALDEGKSGDELPKAYVIDTDHSGERDLENFPILTGLGVVHHQPVKTFHDILVATCGLCGDDTVGFKGIVRPGDWIIMDRATTAWEKIAAYWVETRLKKSLDQLEYEYQMQAEAGKVKQGSALLEYYRSGINPLWFGWEETIRMSGAHCIFNCADQELQLEATKVRGKDSTEKITTFLSAGVVPKMQGDTWAKWHTQILLERPYAKPQWFAKTMGDRGEREWLGAEKRFEVQLSGEKSLGAYYLGEIAGWNRK